jgi:hypothetical protein
VGRCKRINYDLLLGRPSWVESRCSDCEDFEQVELGQRFWTKISYTTVIFKVKSVKTIAVLSSKLLYFAETLPIIIDGIYILRNK